MTFWLLSQLALAAPEPTTAPEEGNERHVRLPPVRVGGAAAYRSETRASGEVELGVQPWRSRPLSLEMYGRFQSAQFLLVPPTPMGNQPDIRHGSLGTSLLVHLDPMVAIGPELVVGVRTYHQDWSVVAASSFFSAGGALQVTLLRTRTWGVALTLRVNAEPLRTVISLDTQQIVPIAPVQAMAGTRVLFGHGRVKGERL